MTDLVLDRPGARLAYDVDGAPGGPVLVQAHGMSASRASEREMGVDLRAAVAAGHALVRYDARAHGASTGRAEPGDYLWSTLADDLLALLDVVSPDRPVDAFGISMGTGTILTAAVRAPRRFRRLALGLPPTAWETRVAQGELYRGAADLIEEHGIDAFVTAGAAFPPPPAAPADWAPVPQVAEALFPSVLRGASRSDLPSTEALAALTQPTLLLPWVDDPGHPLVTAERLAAALPHTTLEPARTHADLTAWGTRVAAFLAASG